MQFPRKHLIRLFNHLHEDTSDNKLHLYSSLHSPTPQAKGTAPSPMLTFCSWYILPTTFNALLHPAAISILWLNRAELDAEQTGKKKSSSSQVSGRFVKFTNRSFNGPPKKD